MVAWVQRTESSIRRSSNILKNRFWSFRSLSWNGRRVHRKINQIDGRWRVNFRHYGNILCVRSLSNGGLKKSIIFGSPRSRNDLLSWLLSPLCIDACNGGLSLFSRISLIPSIHFDSTFRTDLRTLRWTKNYPIFEFSFWQRCTITPWWAFLCACLTHITQCNWSKNPT